MKNGDKIRVPSGRVETVRSVEFAWNEVQVFTEENLGGWYHPSKVVPVYRHVTPEGRTVYVTVPED